jgi:uncharacterized protein YbaR (Trm112 family)
MSDKQTISPDFLAMLRCPVAVHYKDKGDDPGKLRLSGNGKWLLCDDSEYRYPIIDGIPRMLVEIGEKYKGIPEDKLPENPVDE